MFFNKPNINLSDLICRTIFVALGITGFVASKNSVDKKRYESMKVRERMRKANEGKTFQLKLTQKHLNWLKCISYQVNTKCQNQDDLIYKWSTENFHPIKTIIKI